MSQRVVTVAQVVSPTEAEGPGARMAVWVQGCPLRCPGCCNPAMLPMSGGAPTAVEALVERARAAGGDIEGVSLLGGEPTAQAAGLADFAAAVQAIGLSVMVYTGFTLEALRARGDRDVDALLAATDLVVDGPYDQTQPDTDRRWIGSRNQGLHFLSHRYRPTDPQFRAAETIEIRLRPGALRGRKGGVELSVNGWPAPAESLRRPVVGARSKAKRDA